MNGIPRIVPDEVAGTRGSRSWLWQVFSHNFGDAHANRLCAVVQIYLKACRALRQNAYESRRSVKP